MEGNFPRVGSAIVLQVNDKILLGLRNKEPEKGKWVLPGGKIKPFESVKEAARREFLEETGLYISAGKLIGIYEIINPLYEHREHRLIIYSWGILKGELKAPLKPSGDTSEVRLFSREELGQVDMTPTVRQVLKDISWL